MTAVDTSARLKTTVLEPSIVNRYDGPVIVIPRRLSCPSEAKGIRTARMTHGGISRVGPTRTITERDSLMTVLLILDNRGRPVSSCGLRQYRRDSVSCRASVTRAGRVTTGT